MAQGINMTTEFQTNASNKTSTNTNDSNTDNIADDTSVDNVSDNANTENTIDDVVADDTDIANVTTSNDAVTDDADIASVATSDNAVAGDADIANVTTSDDAVEAGVEMAIDSNITNTVDIGNELKEKRLELGLDEKEVAIKLKIPVNQVRALEASDFSYFRSVTFARGFLKSYCRLLELDHVVMIAAFDKERAGAETTIKPVDKVHKQTHLGDPIVIFISVVIVAVLVFLVFWWPTTTPSITSLGNAADASLES